ncbi:hypothetical protein GCM10023187_16460 [Nibrella viscosa]|uniref:Uncharacterized protein n=1 Tax=Nibrella viscosa TaxID=1084524 RepID=A0ABP8K8J4_9BACT
MDGFNLNLRSFALAKAFNQEYKTGDALIVHSLHGRMLWGRLQRPAMALGDQVIINLEGYTLCFHLDQVIGKA